MKTAGITAVAGRDAMRERQRRGRIEAPALRTRYPGLNTLQLDFNFNDRTDVLPSPQVTVFHPPAPAFFCFACPYSDCNGEFNLSSPVEQAVNSHDSHSRGQLPCAGTRHHGIPCTLSLEYSISPQWP